MKHRPHHRRTAPGARRRRRDAPSCRPWATCTRATWRWCALARATRRPGGGEHLRQPPAVRAARGLRHLPAHAGARLPSCCADAGCDLVFAPDEAELYPEPQALQGAAADAELADILEGHFRPGFFTGVCTVVLKLFNCVQPRVAVFGKKDYQQLMVVRQHGARSWRCRSRSSPARPSRRRRPGAVVAQRLPRRRPARRGGGAVGANCGNWRAAAQGGRRDCGRTRSGRARQLAERGWKPDYVAVRRAATSTLPTDGDAAAGRAGRGAARQHAADRQPRIRGAAGDLRCGCDAASQRGVRPRRGRAALRPPDSARRAPRPRRYRCRARRRPALRRRGRRAAAAGSGWPSRRTRASARSASPPSGAR